MPKHRVSILRALATLCPLLAASTIAGAAPPSEPYTGALLLYRLDEVTVVYPSAEGEQGRINRISAECRARFLERVHHVNTRTVRDDEVSESDRQGHLLLLGWDNRLLGTEIAPRPFQHSSNGVSMLGVSDPDPAADLLLFYPSPYNTKRWLVFWSRIDPERDRFMPLPRVGSDWAILHDYTIVNQGMFQAGFSWPPTRNLEAEKDHTMELATLAAHTALRKTEHFDIRYDATVIGDEEFQAIAKSREAAFSKASAALGAPPPGFRIALNIYNDPDQKKERTGVEDATHSVVARREMHVVRQAARWSAPHEETHILARALLGPCYLTSLYEGLAIAVDGSYRDMQLELHAAVLADQGAVPALETLLDEEEARSLPDRATFPGAGLLVAWLRGDPVPDALRRSYGLLDGTPDALARALGKPPEELQRSYAAWVGVRAAERSRDLAFYKAEGEAREKQLVGDYAAVAVALEKALTFRPDDPQTLFNLAAAEMRSGAYAEAETRLKRLLGLKLDPASSRFVIFGYYQLGRLYDIQGQRESALRAYRRVLELPDQHDAHRLAREAIDKPFTAEQLD